MKYFIYVFFLWSSVWAGFDEGVELIKQKDYVEASKQFHVAAALGNSAALFGEAVCDVALGKSDQADEHLDQIQKWATAACTTCQQNSKPTVKEPVSAYNCRLRVRKVIQDLRILVERMVADTVPGFLRKIQTFRRLNPYIDMLERNGLACCQNNSSEERCIEPLVEQLKVWNSEGLPVE